MIREMFRTANRQSRTECLIYPDKGEMKKKSSMDFLCLFFSFRFTSIRVLKKKQIESNSPMSRSRIPGATFMTFAACKRTFLTQRVFFSEFPSSRKVICQSWHELRPSNGQGINLHKNEKWLVPGILHLTST